MAALLRLAPGGSLLDRFANAHVGPAAADVAGHGGVDIGIATQTPAGLMVPVVRHCESLSLWDCAVEVQRLAEAAREGRATRAELAGSTITITSLGALGGIVTTPVINRPEVAIIGVNKQVVRPVWNGGTFVPRTMMNLSSSFDQDRKSTRLNSSHLKLSRMPSSA